MLHEGQPYLLALNRHPKIGSRRLFELKKKLGDWQKVWQASERELNSKVGQELTQIVLDARNKYDPAHEADIVARIGSSVVEFGDKDYPPLLAEIPDPPVFMYYKGSLEPLKKDAIAVVGSRRATEYGFRMTEKIVRPLASVGLTIISGLALGIDTAAHQAALDGHGLTVGVLGCGLDRIYPQTNTILAEKMIAAGGAVMTEFAPGLPSYRSNFPIRNRIVAGMARMTLVVEAMAQSGALITAKAALEYNREVGAVPGDVTRLQAEGSNQLIKQGAALITSADDVLEALGLVSDINNHESTVSQETIDKLSEKEKQIWDALTREPMHANTLSKELILDIADINSTLVVLELNGLIKRLEGNFYVKNG